MALSPMMQHYLTTKEKYKDTILFYRLGDFYEMFFEDAITVSKELDLTLTGKDCGLDERAPMCGIPYHAAENYISKLITLGFKVAICEQLTEPTKGNKLVERDVVRIVTAGTVTEDSMLEETKNNFLAAVCVNGFNVGVSYCDLTTGETYASDMEDDKDFTMLSDFLARVLPVEIICSHEATSIGNKLATTLLNQTPKFFEKNEISLEDGKNVLKEQFGENFENEFGFSGEKESIKAVAMLTEYLKETQKKSFSHLNTIIVVKPNSFMNLDFNTRRNLEISETMNGRKKRGSLLWLLDKTETSMGARLLKQWVDEPLFDERGIALRLAGVNELFSSNNKRESLIQVLSKFCDIDRICGKISLGNLNPRDCLSLASSLSSVPELKKQLTGFSSKILVSLQGGIDNFEPIENAIFDAINLDAPALLTGGGYIKNGYNAQLDQLRNFASGGKDVLTKVEAKERERTGIKNLKISYNRVFGYYIEVNKSQSNLVPFDYIRKQTVANNERYITEELKELEEKIVSSEEQSTKLELKIFETIRQYLLSNVAHLQKLAKIVAKVDCLQSLATVAVRQNYCMPKVSSKINKIDIVDGRHPVIEAILKDDQFICNNTLLNDSTDRTMIITGPNMAGKSTYMRQVALITFMAHIGSFVPAKKAEISLTDRIFTRVGASDDLALGQSTFMVEMLEVATILKNATSKSLLILDEIGRGTATFDGLSIAWAVMEYISKNITAKTLFSTHFHELTELEGVLDGVKNYRISVKEIGDKVIFLRKVVRGGTNKSFGIEVARLAGVPNEVISRAKEILSKLEKSDINVMFPAFKEEDKSKQVEDLSIAKEIMRTLADTNINQISPMLAFDMLANLVEKAKKGAGINGKN
ncbi:MAG: DNA mismatch repair protein MutS [Clostridia bacterium]